MENPAAWLCVGVAVLAVLCWIGSLHKPKCDICEAELKKAQYRWKIDGKKLTVCPNCNRRLESRKSSEAMDRFLGSKKRRR